jgi:hypothetical protein
LKSTQWRVLFPCMTNGDEEHIGVAIDAPAGKTSASAVISPEASERRETLNRSVCSICTFRELVRIECAERKQKGASLRCMKRCRGAGIGQNLHRRNSSDSRAAQPLFAWGDSDNAHQSIPTHFSLSYEARPRPKKGSHC